jgi:S1-C subfamily serine protease
MKRTTVSRSGAIIARQERTTVNRVISGLLTVGLTAVLALKADVQSQATALPLAEPTVTLLDMHPVDPAKYPSEPALGGGLPRVVSTSNSTGSAADQRQVRMPNVVTPSQPADEASGNADGKAGTGFFISDDGTLLTAAHVASGCNRMQIISKFVARSWVSPVATDQEHDIAILKAPGVRPPAVVRLASVAPTGGKLFIIGYPASASLTVPAETWAVMENEKFPANIGSLTNPRDLLWMSAPDVTHGYSGGPIFDPRSGSVVGIVKGEVDGGYLRLVRDMPTTGIAIGPGIASIAALVRREVPYAAVSLASSSGNTGVEGLRRATVHVLCWN